MRRLLWRLKRLYLALFGKPCSKNSLRIYITNECAKEYNGTPRKLLLEAILAGMAGNIDTNTEEGKNQIEVLDAINDIMQKKALIHKNDTFLQDDFC